MFRPTILDILTTLDTSTEIWNARADYWDNVALRHDRAARPEQADRLRANAQKMRDEGQRLARMQVKADRETKRLAKLSPVAVPAKAVAAVPVKSEKISLVNAMMRTPIAGGFKSPRVVKGKKAAPVETIASAFTRSRKGAATNGATVPADTTAQ